MDTYSINEIIDVFAILLDRYSHLKKKYASWPWPPPPWRPVLTDMGCPGNHRTNIHHKPTSCWNLCFRSRNTTCDKTWHPWHHLNRRQFGVPSHTQHYAPTVILKISHPDHLPHSKPYQIVKMYSLFPMGSLWYKQTPFLDATSLQTTLAKMPLFDVGCCWTPNKTYPVYSGA